MLIGDLNVTPDSRLFRAILAAGFREPDVVDRRATFGGGLGTGRVNTSGWRIDHILVRGIDARVTSRRIFDTPIALRGSGVRTTLSDHFGVFTVIEPQKRAPR